MARKGKGRHYRPQPFKPEVKARFQALITNGKLKPIHVKVIYPAHWGVRPKMVNQLWRWDTLEDVNI